jgi:hypothetical protein
MSDRARSTFGTSPISKSRPVVYNLRPVLVGGFGAAAIVNNFWPDFGGLWLHGLVGVGLLFSGVELIVQRAREVETLTTVTSRPW